MHLAAIVSITFFRWWREMVERVNLKRHRKATFGRNAKTAKWQTTRTKWKEKNYCSINILFILFRATYIISTEFMVLIYDVKVAARSLLKMAQRESKWPHRVCARLVQICLLSHLSTSQPAYQPTSDYHIIYTRLFSLFIYKYKLLTNLKSPHNSHTLPFAYVQCRCCRMIHAKT